MPAGVIYGHGGRVGPTFLRPQIKFETNSQVETVLLDERLFRIPLFTGLKIGNHAYKPWKTPSQGVLSLAALAAFRALSLRGYEAPVYPSAGTSVFLGVSREPQSPTNSAERERCDGE